MPSEGLAAAVTAPTHKIAALRTYVYPSPTKTPPLTLLSLNALVSAAGRGPIRSLKDGGGFISPSMPGRSPSMRQTSSMSRWLSRHALSLGRPHSLGVDCSGLVQLASEAAGLPCPRDADMQAKSSAAG